MGRRKIACSARAAFRLPRAESDAAARRSVRAASYLSEHMFPFSDTPHRRRLEASRRPDPASRARMGGAPAGPGRDGHARAGDVPVERAAPSWRDSVRRAAGLARAFLLLEDPELEARAASPRGPAAPQRATHHTKPHPHRPALRRSAAPRRPGAGRPRPQPCRSPLR
jgi:hypothetical protein